ncbi:ATP-binding protein [Cohnella fermenti]|uniref:Circadian input-output histidine kinase CikA n=1 Tax=Cohnella fermenti TaxID=2565925 RepID=A0A4S4BZM1_9BACL|nr:ATP-binding protein [Cohnella fermenti]THF80735.1 response regulator [Cohnella fermenti]
MNRLKQAVVPVVFLSLLVAGCCWYLLLSYRSIDGQAPEAVQGVLDLTEWNREGQSIVPLNGQWEFYEGRLLEPKDFMEANAAGGAASSLTGYEDVPSAWEVGGEAGEPSSFGYGTYRLTIRLPASGDGRYGIIVNNVKTAHRLFADGAEIGSGGIPGAGRTSTEAANLPYASYLEASGGKLQIVLQVANYDYTTGGITHPIYFGEQKAIAGYRDKTVALDAVTGFIILLLGAYMIVLYRMRSGNQDALLWFGLTCIANFVYLMTHGDKLFGLMFPDMSYIAFTKLQFLSGLASEYSLLMYTRLSFPRYAQRWIVRTFEAELAVRLLVILAAPSAVFSSWDWLYYLLSFALMFYCMGIMGRSAVRRDEGALYMALSALFIFLINLGSFLYNGGAMAAYSLQPISFVGFMLCQLLFLSRRFTRAFTTVERLSEKLKSLDKLKDEFMANTSHELRTPLHAMINIAQSMLDGAAGKMSSVQGHNLSLIVNSGRRMSHLVGDILDFSKLNNGEIVLRADSVDLKALVKVVLEMHAVSSNLRVRPIDRLPDTLPRVRGDEDRLTQILHNLIGNAFKFTSEGEVAVSASARNGWVAVTVSDTGVGIPQDRQEAVFESFEQADSSIARDYGGMGLGLSVTKKLVELHGGSISVRSQPGEGAAFTFTLPIASPLTSPTASPAASPTISSAASPAASPAAEYVAAALERSEAATVPDGRQPERQDAAPRVLARHPQTILVVDDDAANRQVLINLLTMESYSVLTACGGEEALQLLEERKDVELVVLDLMMPRMSGYEVCRAIRTRYSLSELPVLILTARSRMEDRLLGFEAGANDYLGKPVEAEELKARVRTLLEMKSSARELVRSELDFLRAQIKPHFLFNALNAVLSASYTDVERSREMLGRLSQFLRGSFDFDSREELIPFAKELEQTKSYLFIEQARFGERLKLEFDIEDGLDALVPPLIVQPIVENAVRHGATKRLSGGTVSIVARSEGAGGIVVEVADNGPGMPQAEEAGGDEAGDNAAGMNDAGAEGARLRRTGVGLANVRRRLRTLYGTELEIDSASGQGTKITLRIGAALSRLREEGE